MSRAATATATSSDLVDAAQHALALARDDPRLALAQADALLAALPRPRTEPEVRAAVTAHRAAGQALRNLGETPHAIARLRRGVAMADRHGFLEVAAEGRMTLSFLLLEVGQLRPALATIDQALASLRGLMAAKARTNRALILHRAGRVREALEEYAAALPVIRRAGDTFSESLARSNRAQLYAEQGDTAAAVADLEWARRDHLENGRRVDAADALWNLGALYELAGDYPRALDLFDKADLEWGDIDRPQRFTSRAVTLLDAGLPSEALELARVGAEWAHERGWFYAEAEARLWHALAALSLPQPDLDTAAAQARTAARDFRRQGRPDWQVQAEVVELTVRLERGARTADLDRAVEIASKLRDLGREAHAADVRLRAGLAAMHRGDAGRGRTLLGPLANQTTSRQLEVRSRAWYARALLEIDADDAASASSLLRAWRLNDEQAALRGATELRAAAASHADDIVRSGCERAIRRGSPRTAYEWSERGRGASLRPSTVRGAHDPELAAALARLRWSATAEEDSLQDGENDPAARSRRRRDEAEVLRLSRRRPGSGPSSRPASWSELRAGLEGRVFLHFLQHEGRIWAVRLDEQASSLEQLVAIDDVQVQVETLTFALRRLLTGRSASAAARASMLDAATGAAARLSAMVLEPLAPPPGGELVVCPVGPLCHVPWTAVSAHAGVRTLVAAPSATAWLAARARPVPPVRRPLVVAGPGLDGAVAEVERVASLYDGAVVLTGQDATVERVVLEMRTASIAHIAAHGRLRRDNPLFSTLLLDDGPLTAYDLELAAGAPAEVILPACSSGAGHTLVGDEVLGLAWTLLAQGAARVLAPVLPVPDAATSTLMSMLHEHLSAGTGLAESWTLVQERAAADDDLALVPLAFTLYGG